MEFLRTVVSCFTSMLGRANKDMDSIAAHGQYHLLADTRECVEL